MSIHVPNGASQPADGLLKLISFLPGVQSFHRDARIPGESGILREIEMLASHRVGDTELRVLFDTKRKTKRLGHDDILEVDSIRSDVGAHLAIVVAPKGCQRQTRMQAQASNVFIFRSLDVSTACLEKRVLLPAFLDLRILAYLAPPEVPLPYPELDELLQRCWEAGELPEDLDESAHSVVIACWKGETVSSLKLRIQEKRYRGYRRIPLGLFGSLSGRSRLLTGAAPPLVHLLQDWDASAEAEVVGAVASFSDHSVQRASLEAGTLSVPFGSGKLSFPQLPSPCLHQTVLCAGEIPLGFSYPRR